MSDTENTTLMPPIGQPIDLAAEPWTPPVSEPQIFGGPTAPPGFHEWAEKWVAQNAPVVERKAAEYGSNSLARKGRRYARAQSRTVSTAEALELGAAQYVLEKLDRVEDSMLRQQPPSGDTWLDVAVYALMVAYIRENGRWL